MEEKWGEETHGEKKTGEGPMANGLELNMVRATSRGCERRHSGLSVTDQLNPSKKPSRGLEKKKYYDKKK